MMEIGIDSFAAISDEPPISTTQAISELLERIAKADSEGLDIFGVGEHHRKDFLDASPTVILGAAAAITTNIRLTTAVTVLSTADPVRVFQNHATLDLISNGRAEIIVGRGSFSEAFPLFGYKLQDYDALFNEKLALLLKIQTEETIHWEGQFRAPLINQTIFPKPVQNPLPIWVGTGGSLDSCKRAGTLGLPLMLAVIGGETHRFKPHIDRYKKAGLEAGHPEDQLKVGLHALGYVAETSQQAKEDFYPGYAKIFTKIGQERGWPPVTKETFLKQTDATGAFLIGDPTEVANKIIDHSQALGGLSRLTFQMNVAALPHHKLMNAIELIGNHVAPMVKKKLNAS